MILPIQIWTSFTKPNALLVWYVGLTAMNIPITNGTYNVKLHFAEIYWGAAEPNGDPTGGGTGSRVFDVDIEGQVVLNDYDIFEEVGVSYGT